ncbi:MAG: sigma-54 dependent transcriptional regulator [Candidatus Eisenbacteria bacterium]
MAARTVLIVDDETNIRRTLAGLLEDEGYAVESCGDAEEGLRRVRAHPPDLLLLDVRLPGMDGLAFLEILAKEELGVPVVMMSGHATVDAAVRATKLGAFDFLEKPVDPERLLLVLAHCLEITRLRAENRILRERTGAAASMIGEHPAMRELRDEIARAAPSSGRVLVMGENGTGKELVARAIHLGSDRKEGPFVQVNCAAIPKDLIESELFGHEKGSFTGATERRIGKIEQADRGTLLLDEVGDMSLETQAKLLRVLEARELERVGGRTTIPFDVRFVSATNKNLRREIEEKRFREDLYYRLAVIPITVPPLRERASDIPLLIGHFLRRFTEENGKRPKRFDQDALDLLVGYRWPGNVRELRNLLERLFIMVEESEIGPDRVARFLGEGRTGPTTAAPPAGSNLRDRVDRFETDLIRESLRRHGGNVAETARDLSTDRANLHRKMKRHGIDPKKV